MTRKTAAILQFPGTNCDQDTVRWLARNLELNVSLVRSHEDVEQLPPGDTTVIVLPGGFSLVITFGPELSQLAPHSWIGSVSKLLAE